MRILKGLVLAGVLALVPACSENDDAEEPVAKDSMDEVQAASSAYAQPAAAPVPASDPAPAAAPAPAPAAAAAPAVTPPPALAPAAAEPAGFDGAKTTRYVRVVAIKVHALPDKESAVIGWVKMNEGYEVIINGDWAKMGPGHYISNKFLVDRPVATPVAAPAKKSKAGK